MIMMMFSQTNFRNILNSSAKTLAPFLKKNGNNEFFWVSLSLFIKPIAWIILISEGEVNSLPIVCLTYITGDFLQR